MTIQLKLSIEFFSKLKSIILLLISSQFKFNLEILNNSSSLITSQIPSEAIIINL